MTAFEGFTQATLDFMWNLRFNNNREWFEANKDAFIRDFQTPMKALGREVFERITVTSADAGLLIRYRGYIRTPAA